MTKDYKYNVTHDIRFDIRHECHENSMVCAYSVNTSCKIPFLSFLLVNDSGVWNFPQITQFDFHKLGIERKGSANLNDDLSSSLTPFLFEEKINGSMRIENAQRCKNSFLIYDVTEYPEFPETFTLVLIDEIMNSNNCLGLPISNTVTEFFLLNSDLIYLTDNNDQKLEIPVVGYIQTPNPDFVYEFGIAKSDKQAILGPYYYFTDYANAKRRCLESSKEKLSIVRFALFMGSMLVKHNFPNDNIDESNIKLERLEDPTLTRKYECLTMRISDHEGLWADTYDSVFLGKIELDDGNFISESPILVVRRNDQFCALSKKTI